MMNLARTLTAGVMALACALPALANSSQAGAALKNFNSKHEQALGRAIKGDSKGALKILNGLTTAAVSDADKDRLFLSIGRVYYQAGNDKAAIEAYEKVRKHSPSWLESLEERAWAQVRSGQPDKAIASLKTVLLPMFQDRVHSEPFFLASLAQLRVCDFPQVFKTIEKFKERYRPRIQAWENSGSDPLAKKRLKETSQTIQKMNLVEAEAIQRLYLDENGKRQPGRVAKIQRGDRELTFPETNSDEVWMDEIDSYRVSLKGCPRDPGDQVVRKEK